MADRTMEVREPESVVTTEVDLLTIKVVLSVPGFQVKKHILNLYKPKPRNAEVLIKFEERMLEVDVTIKEKNVNYQLKIRQLPGAIINCEEQYAKDRITLTLTKKEEQSWVASLGKGLETA